MTRPAATEEKLPTGQALAYGVGQMAHQIFGSGIGYLAFYVFSIALGVSPVLVGVAQSVARGVDLVTDPLAGYLTDSLRRRIRPGTFIAAGSLLGGASFALIWIFPPGLSPSGYFLWLLVCFSVSTVGWSFCSVPRQALGIEMTADSYQRTKLMAIASFMAMLCNLGMAWSYAAAQLPAFGGTVNGARWVGGCMAAAIIVFGLISAWFCKEKKAAEVPVLAAADEFRAAGWRDFFVAMRRVGRSRPFILLIAAVVLVTIGQVTISFGVEPCLAIYYICHGSQAHAAVILGGGSAAWIIAGLICTGPILWLSQRIGKKETFGVFLALAFVATGLRWFCYNPTWPSLFLIPQALFGAGLSAMAVLAPAMTADACDLEESVSGARDSGLFSAFFNWTVKLGTAVGMFISGLLLNLVGFHAGTRVPQSPRTILAMRLADIGLPALTIVAALILIVRYPITAKKMEEVRAMLSCK